MDNNHKENEIRTKPKTNLTDGAGVKVLDVLSENLLLPPKRSFPLRFGLGPLRVDHPYILPFTKGGGGKGGRARCCGILSPLLRINKLSLIHI